MSVLIAMAVYCTEKNNKDEYLRKTLRSLSNTVDFDNHKLALSINSHTEYTEEILEDYSGIISNTFWNEKNLGTAEAINKVWQTRAKDQHCVKMDDDVVIHGAGWLEDLLDCINCDPTIGIIGLKRKDTIENPKEENPYFRSELQMLPHIPGHPWRIVESVHHVMGTVQLYNSALLDKIGYLYQPTLYGYDDVLACCRSKVGGFKNVFYPQINIDHIDPGGGEFTAWKQKEAGEQMAKVNEIMNEYKTGKRSIYYNPFL